MREIKFRAWDIFYKKFIYGEYSNIANNMDEFWTIVKGGENSGREVPLMQYTGLKDKNDKEIYEGDILKYHSKINPERQYHKRLVFFNDKKAKFSIKKIDTNAYGNLVNEKSKRSYEIIGNIYENPELLK